jgi:mannose-1-phosphate guanylyltransferase
MKYFIRAGGIGTRLWPLSRKAHPKQFQTLVGDKSMIRTTYERLLPLLHGPEDVFISVNERFVHRLVKELPEVPEHNFVVETDTRNTGPAMCLEVCFLAEHVDRGEIIASVPSDDYIADSEAFRDLLRASEQFVTSHHEYILTPAVTPSYPDTGYSYFKAGKNLQQVGAEGIFEIDDIVEKPEPDFLKDIIKSGLYYAHTGMYIWRLGRVLDLFAQHQPAMFETCREIAKIMTHNPSDERIRARYAELEKMTIETALTEHVEKLAMSVSNRIGWSDLGKWHIVKRMAESEPGENVTKGTVVHNGATNNLLYSTIGKKVLVANDIHDLVVVDTDDALFISSLKKSADIKEIIEKLKEMGLEDHT